MKIIKFEPLEDQAGSKDGEVIYDFECDDEMWEFITNAAKEEGLTEQEYIVKALMDLADSVITKKEEEDNGQES